MRCPHCKAKNPDNAIYCCACDVWILEPINREKKPPPRRDFWYRLRVRKRLLITVSAITAFCILLVCTLPHLQANNPAPTTPTPDIEYPYPETDFVLCRYNIEPIIHKNRLCFIFNEQLLETEYMDCQNFVTSLDGGAAAVLTDDNTLLYIRNHTVTPIANNVNDFKLSVSGDGIVFLDTNHVLYHYHVDHKGIDLIYDANPGLMDYEISPDGKSVAFFRDASRSSSIASVLWVYQNQQAFPYRSYNGNQHNIISISDNGQYIYTSDSTVLFCYSNQILTTIGQFAAGISNQRTYSNADHTQLLFYQNDGTYLSVNGQAATFISPEQLASISPEQTQSVRLGSTLTEPVKDLCSSLYLSNTTTSVTPNYTLWSFSEDGVCIPLSTNFYSYKLDPAGQYFYYCTSFSDLYLLDTNTIRKPQHIASNVTQFAITYNNSALFYTTKDATYIRNAAGETVALATHPRLAASILLVASDNHLYRIADLTSNFQTLSILSDNSRFEVIMQNIRSSYRKTASGLLYIDTDSGLYLCHDGTLTKVLTY